MEYVTAEVQLQSRCAAKNHSPRGYGQAGQLVAPGTESTLSSQVFTLFPAVLEQNSQSVLIKSLYILFHHVSVMPFLFR